MNKTNNININVDTNADEASKSLTTLNKNLEISKKDSEDVSKAFNSMSTESAVTSKSISTMNGSITKSATASDKSTAAINDMNKSIKDIDSKSNPIIGGFLKTILGVHYAVATLNDMFELVARTVHAVTIPFRALWEGLKVGTSIIMSVSGVINNFAQSILAIPFGETGARVTLYITKFTLLSKALEIGGKVIKTVKEYFYNYIIKPIKAVIAIIPNIIAKFKSLFTGLKPVFDQIKEVVSNSVSVIKNQLSRLLSHFKINTDGISNSMGKVKESWAKRNAIVMKYTYAEIAELDKLENAYNKAAINRLKHTTKLQGDNTRAILRNEQTIAKNVAIIKESNKKIISLEQQTQTARTRIQISAEKDRIFASKEMLKELINTQTSFRQKEHNIAEKSSKMRESTNRKEVEALKQLNQYKIKSHDDAKQRGVAERAELKKNKDSLIKTVKETTASIKTSSEVTKAVFNVGSSSIASFMGVVQKAMGPLGNLSKKFAVLLSKFPGGAMGVLAFAGTLTLLGKAFFKVTAQVVKLGDTIAKGSSKLGMSIKEYQKWDGIMNMAGGSITSLQTINDRLIGSMKDATPINKQGMAFKGLGISIRDSSGQLRDQQDVLKESMIALAGMSNKTERNALSQELLGRSARELNPILDQGAKAVNKLVGAESGMITMSTEMARASETVTDSNYVWMKSIEKLKNDAIEPFVIAWAKFITSVKSNSELNNVLSVLGKSIGMIVQTVVDFGTALVSLATNKWVLGALAIGLAAVAVNMLSVNVAMTAFNGIMALNPLGAFLLTVVAVNVAIDQLTKSITNNAKVAASFVTKDKQVHDDTLKAYKSMVSEYNKMIKAKKIGSALAYTYAKDEYTKQKNLVEDYTGTVVKENDGVLNAYKKGITGLATSTKMWDLQGLENFVKGYELQLDKLSKVETEIEDLRWKTALQSSDSMQIIERLRTENLSRSLDGRIQLINENLNNEAILVDRDLELEIIKQEHHTKALLAIEEERIRLVAEERKNSKKGKGTAKVAELDPVFALMSQLELDMLQTTVNGRLQILETASAKERAILDKAFKDGIIADESVYKTALEQNKQLLQNAMKDVYSSVPVTVELDLAVETTDDEDGSIASKIFGFSDEGDLKEKVDSITSYAVGKANDILNVVNGFADLAKGRRDKELNDIKIKQDAEMKMYAGSAKARAGMQATLDKKMDKLRKIEGDKAKKAQIAGAIINMAGGIAAAVALAMTLGPIAGPIVGVVNSAIVATGAGIQIAKIKQQEFTEGGIVQDSVVQGQSYSGDKIPIKVNSKEVVLNDRQQATLLELANGQQEGSKSNSGDVSISIENFRGGDSELSNLKDMLIDLISSNQMPSYA